MSTQQAWSTLVTIGGLSLDGFDTFDGGEKQAEPTKSRSGASRQMKQYPVLGDYTDVTVSRVLERERDHDLLIQLDRMAGWALGSVARQPMDIPTGLPWGKARLYSGMLMNVSPGASDINSTEKTMITLTLQITDVR